MSNGGSSRKRDRRSLADTHPQLVAEALFDPTTVTAGSNRKERWRCAKGHEWEAVVAKRAIGGGCPVCAGKKVLPGANDLATTHPELAREALFDPRTVTAGSSKKLPWRCAKGHEWEAQPNSRTASHSGCPVCGNKAVLPGYNDLATTHPELAKEALFDPTTVTAGSSARKLPWRCAKGHEWEVRVKNRTTQGAGCPVCAGKAVQPGYNDLATTHPEIAKEALFDPTTVTAGSNKRLPWRCPLGHEWEAPVVGRGVSGEGCPVCAGKKVVPGVNDLATTHPEIAKEASFDPATVIAGSHKVMPWRCAKGHEWDSIVRSRTERDQDCPYCANRDLRPRRVTRTLLPGYNDLATTHPELAKEALFDPTTVSFGVLTKVRWRCAKGHEWVAPVAGRASRGEGCPYCSNTTVLPGYNDLATTHPALAREALFDPTTVMAGSGKKLPWRCPEGHEWRTTVSSRSKGRGCPSCAVSGFDPGKQAWVYLMRQPVWEMLQIGITNDFDTRMRSHRGNGWELLDARGPMPGDAARGWELSFLNLLHTEGVELTASGAKEEPARTGRPRLGGVREAWWEAEYPVESLGALMEAVRAAEWQQ